MSRILGLVLSLLALTCAGCSCSEHCETAMLPYQGIATSSEELYEIVSHTARYECWSELYDHLSQATRDEHSYIKIRPFISGWKAEEPWEYRVMDILAKGELLGVWPDGPNGGELLMITYQEPGRPELLAHVLVVNETDETGREIKRLGLQEQHEEGPALNQEPD
ncbi:MAG: hypothetical protein JKY65_23730 [Planctomycetes bacterium]|nr:hypothetical protein [Planctomycetota bacterium]